MVSSRFKKAARWLGGAWAAVSPDYVMTLVVVPVVVGLAGSHWSLERVVEPVSVELVPASGSEMAPPRVVSSGNAWVVPIGATLEARFEPPLTGVDAIEFVSRPRDAFDIALDGDAPLFIGATARPGPRGFRPPVSRELGTLRLTAAWDRLWFLDRSPDQAARVASIRAVRELHVAHGGLVVVVWGVWLALYAAARGSRWPTVARRWLGRWARLDLAAGVVMCMSIVLRFESPDVWWLAWASLVALGSFGLRWLVGSIGFAATMFNLFSITALALGAAWWLRDSIVQRVEQVHTLDVDHRMKPNGRNINRDGVRFRGDADVLTEENFVVLVLGDSFTFGLSLTFEEAYPAQLEGMLRTRCDDRIRVVNMGWPSASPLLAYRLALDIAAKYRPDLVLYTLDMTDFADDLLYEQALGAERTPSLAIRDVVRVAVRQLAARFFSAQDLDDFRSKLRLAGRNAAQPVMSTDRFFVTAVPLSESREAIDAGVMRNLARLHRYARDVLDVPFVLVVPPRAYQYSRRESPRNWERDDYEIMGPYALEPFRYFEIHPPAYPVYSLLETFATAEEFPLFQEEDPHWNATGARLAAEGVAERLLRDGTLPCQARP